MIHRPNCGCPGCVRSIVAAKWLVSHKYGDISVVCRRSLAPADARQFAAAIVELAQDADIWRQAQLDAAAIEATPITERSTTGVTH